MATDAGKKKHLKKPPEGEGKKEGPNVQLT